jgi:hypothetical protein
VRLALHAAIAAVATLLACACSLRDPPDFRASMGGSVPDGGDDAAGGSGGAPTGGSGGSTTGGSGGGGPPPCAALEADWSARAVFTAFEMWNDEVMVAIGPTALSVGFSGSPDTLVNPLTDCTEIDAVARTAMSYFFICEGHLYERMVADANGVMVAGLTALPVDVRSGGAYPFLLDEDGIVQEVGSGMIDTVAGDVRLIASRPSGATVAFATSMNVGSDVFANTSMHTADIARRVASSNTTLAWVDAFQELSFINNFSASPSTFVAQTPIDTTAINSTHVFFIAPNAADDRAELWSLPVGGGGDTATKIACAATLTERWVHLAASETTIYIGGQTTNEARIYRLPAPN